VLSYPAHQIDRKGCIRHMKEHVTST